MDQNQNYTQLLSCQLKGHSLETVTVEALASRGLAQLRITGLPDTWLRDSRDKIQALAAHLESWNSLNRILIHILPADEIKNGAHLELALALACLIVLNKDAWTEQRLLELKNYCFIGHLSLEGKILSTPLIEEIYSSANLQIVGPNEYSSLKELWDDLRIEGYPRTQKISKKERSAPVEVFDPVPFFGRVRERQLLALAAITKAPVLLMGNPGLGKSKLARWAYSLIPLQRKVREEDPFREIPFIAPHNRSHLWEFLGAQKGNQSQIGIFSRAHNGILVLDEFAELNRDVREILRTILDHKKVQNFARGRMNHYSADFWLIATTNPCPCGNSQPLGINKCCCPQHVIDLYSRRISGPLFDRFGIKVFLSAQNVTRESLFGLPIDPQDWDLNLLAPFQKVDFVPCKNALRRHFPQLTERSLFLKAQLAEVYSKLTRFQIESTETLLFIKDLVEEEETLLMRRPNYRNF